MIKRINEAKQFDIVPNRGIFLHLAYLPRYFIITLRDKNQLAHLPTECNFLTVKFFILITFDMLLY